MAKLSQIQISFAPVEDRLLLRIATDDDNEFRFWLTRRYVKLLWPVLGQMLVVHPSVGTATSTQAQDAVIEFQREAALATADFDSEFNNAPKQLPSGESPLLLVRVQHKRNPSSAAVLCLHPTNGQGIEFALEPQLLHSLRALLQDGLAKADWDLDISPTFEHTNPPVVLN